MKLTEKDAEFLHRLRSFMDTKHLSVELKRGTPSYMVLRGTYGDKIHTTFGMTRQGVRWRFWRIFNDIYVSAYTTILFIEKTFGTELRGNAIQISRECYALRRQILESGFQSADTLLAKKPDTAAGEPAGNEGRRDS
jgi:hypothetical protein